MERFLGTKCLPYITIIIILTLIKQVNVLHALSHLTLIKIYTMNITGLVGKAKKQDVKAGNRQSQGSNSG